MIVIMIVVKPTCEWIQLSFTINWMGSKRNQKDLD